MPDETQSPSFTNWWHAAPANWQGEIAQELVILKTRKSFAALAPVMLSARARQAAAKPPADRASSALRPARAASQPGAKRPTEAVTDATDCTTWWRIHDQRVECFDPYRTTRGATQVEGFDKCAQYRWGHRRESALCGSVGPAMPGYPRACHPPP